MTDKHFDELMRDAAHTYNMPADPPPYDEMWLHIEHAIDPRALRIEPRRSALFRQNWLLLAAILIVGLALGRASFILFPASGGQPETVARENYAPDNYDAATSEYLGHAAAMLVALPGELRSRQPNPAYFTQLDDLLLQTRLLLDSPAGEDPAFRNLLEDLEVVLIQVVRLQSDRDPMKIELLNEALEQRDVMPRLRNAVVSHIGD